MKVQHWKSMQIHTFIDNHIYLHMQIHIHTQNSLENKINRIASMENLRIVLPLILILSFQFPPQTTCFNNQTDLLSLLAFKSNLQDSHAALDSWNETVHFCEWKGIRCGRRHPDRVVEVNLMSQGLVGPLSPHLGNLSFLKFIDLHNNSFHGPIPQEISLLRRLEHLNLSNNSFIGPIPTNLSHSCPNLVDLNLIDNRLSGTIPTDLGFLSKLKGLGLSFNKLSGHIPPSIGNITSLIQLSLGACGLKGEIPESLARLQSVEHLISYDNSLTGTIPSAIFNISSIQVLDVSGNQLHGVIPSSIGLTLSNVRELYLAFNQLSGPIPISISNASSLEYIFVSSNNFTGPIPRVGRLTHLRAFLFSWNVIADSVSFISSLTNSTKLEYLEVSRNLLTGTLPDSIANLSSLIRLNLGENKIHGKIPSGVGNLISLTFIRLSNNNLEGSFPIGITKLSKLHQLHLFGNKLTDKLPTSLGNLTFLVTLYLNGNNFLGNLPSSISNCTDLLELELSNNGFNGPIPPEIMNLSSVSIIFNLSYNNFEGSIPYEVGSLKNLGALDLSNNRLSEEIPNSLIQCTSLQILYLEGNLLKGEIPFGLSALKGIQYLDLSRNNLSGTVPSYLEKMDLKYLNLSFNRLQGEVPMNGIFKNKTLVSLEGNKELCGGIRELKLPSCSSVKSLKKNSSTLLKILFPILVAGGICVMLLLFINYIQRKHKRDQNSTVSPSIGIQFMRLSYADLLKATREFSESNLLGAGSYGSVYKGYLDDGQMFIAVKVLNLVVRGAVRSFMTECNALRGIRHRNLLKILSVCDSIDFQGNNFKALVYEFKANGSLEKWLHHNRGQEESGEEARNLNLIQRLNIAFDVAQAIEYLHFGTDLSIVHGDLKPSNILLDHEMTACVGDFGLAKIIPNIIVSHESSSSVGIKGTLGYVAPEYAMNNSITVQGDIYSYGILLLEIFTNKRPTDEMFKDNVDLHSFVSNVLPNQAMEIVDPYILIGPEMINSKVKDCLVSILSIGVACSRIIPRDRMLITDVIREIGKIKSLLFSSG